MWAIAFLLLFCCFQVKNADARPEDISCTGPHEHYACGSACDTECATLNERCPIVNIKCNDKCYCDKGYARNETNVCIPIEHCKKSLRQVRYARTDSSCGPNEVYKLNKKDCPPDTCLSIVARFKCDPNERAKPGCVCKDGFLRMDEGEPCTPLRQCPELANSDFN